MKCLGLIGGIDWESTALYHQLINEEVDRRFGRAARVRLLVDSLEFASLDQAVRTGEWHEAGAMLAAAAQMLAGAGAEGLVICSDLLHFVARYVEAVVKIPLLHVGDAIIRSVPGDMAHVGLLGSRFALGHNFLLNRQPHSRWNNLQVSTPAPEDLDHLDRIINQELDGGMVDPGSVAQVLRMAVALHQQGAHLVVLTSSELSRLFPTDLILPGWLCNSAELHARAVVQWALGGENRPVERDHASLVRRGLPFPTS